MYEKISMKISGISPLIVHNGHLADPMNHFAKALKEVSGKRKKTDADYAEMSRIEWFGGLYVNEDDRPIIPGVNIEGAFMDAGRKQRMGDAFKAGLISDGSWLIEYDGPKTAAELWKKSGIAFTDRRGVKVGPSTVFRTRPIFRKWALSFDVHFLPDLLNKKQVIDSAQMIGRIIGIGDYTPKHGRFELVN